MNRLQIICAAVVAVWAGSCAFSTEVRSQFVYSSTVTSDGEGPLDLIAELNYDDSVKGAPIAVVMHGFSPAMGNLQNVRPNALRLRKSGFFVVSVAMRGRDGSDGKRDSGGLEIYDIYDAVEATKEFYPELVDPTNVHITGYSGGGGNVMSALTRFPDYFRLGAAFFGMSDYGFDPVNGWYSHGAGRNHQAILDTDVGNPNTGGDAVTDRYHARAVNLASRNNPYSEIHLFVNSDEVTSPPVNHHSYQQNAISNASFEGEFDNIMLHVGDPTQSTFEDFNGNGVDEPSELQFWPHRFPTVDQQAAAEQWYLDRLLNDMIAAPALNASDQLLVPGFVKTQHFELWLGDGQNAAAELGYSLSAISKTFDLTIVSNDLSQQATLWVELGDMQAEQVQVFRNGAIVAQVPVAESPLKIQGVRHGDQLTIVIPEPSGWGLAWPLLMIVVAFRGARNGCDRLGRMMPPISEDRFKPRLGH